MKRLTPYFFQLSIILLLFPGRLKGEAELTTIPLRKYDFGKMDLGHQASYYYDDTGDLTAAEIVDKSFQVGKAFNLSDQKFWITRGNIWVKVALANLTNDTLRCHTLHDWHSFIDLYELADPPKLKDRRGKLRPMKVNHIAEFGIFPLKISPRDTLQLLYSYNNRLAKRSRDYKRLQLFSEAGIHQFLAPILEQRNLEGHINFFLIAFLFSVTCYTFFQYLQIRDRTFLAYFGYVFLSMLFLFRDSSTLKVITPFFHSIPELVAYSGPFFTITANLCYILFLQLFLDLKVTLPGLNRFLNVVAISLIVLLVLDIAFLSLTGEIKVHLFLFSIVRLAIHLISIGVVIFIALYGRQRLKYFIIIGVSCLMLGSIINLGLNGYYIYNYNSNRFIHQVFLLPDLALAVGIILELLCFSLGLGYKTNLNLMQKVKAEEHLRVKEKEAAYLQQVQEVRNQFYTNITHEFRTPLSIILGVAGQVKKEVPEEGAVQLEMIERNGRHLLQMVNQLLDLSKIESGKLELKYVQSDIVNFLRYLTESFHSLAEQKAIQLHFLSDIDSLVMDHDPERLQQIYYNLLSNALKFTPEGGNVYFQLAQVNDRQLELKVKDTGIGIAKDQLSKIFDRFYQLDAGDTRRAEGTGIGLALVRDLLQLMDGTITVKSKLGRGTEFVLRLPIRHDAPAGTAIDLPASVPRNGGINTKLPILPQPVEGAKVLVIEDNPDVRFYIRNCLASVYRIEMAFDGEDGIQKAQKLIPDLIICDVMMPLKDGFEVCATLKQDRRTSHIPIVMLTAKADFQSRVQGLQHGADLYLAKPFQEEELLLHLQNLLLQRERLQRHYLFVSGLTEQTIPDRTGADPETDFVGNVKARILENLADSSFTVSQLSREMALSQSQLHRKLTALTGYSPSKLIRMIRLHHAKKLLQDQALTITAVAYDSGFSDPDYMSKLFKREFGITPTAYRKELPTIKKV